MCDKDRKTLYSIEELKAFLESIPNGNLVSIVIDTEEQEKDGTEE